MLNATKIFLIFIRFWYYEALLEMLAFFKSLNIFFVKSFALMICLKTFFRPLKNEYREGLVGFSRGLGIVVKSCIIITDFFMLSLLLAVECVIIICFLLFPAITILLLFL